MNAGLLDLSPQEAEAVWLSLKVAGVATLAGPPFAVLVAYILARFAFPGHAILNALSHLPLVLPPVVTGYALLFLFGRQGPLGAFLAEYFGVVFAFRWTGAALAAGVMSFPLLIRPMRLSFEAIDPRLTQAARSLGAGPRRPLSSSNCRSLCLESSRAAFSASPRRSASSARRSPSSPTFRAKRRTIPAAIYSLMQSPDGDAGAARLALISVAIAVTALLVSEALQRRAGARA